MERDSFHSDFGDKLKDYQVHTDHDALWDAISDQVPQKRKRRFFLLPLIGIAALSALCIIYRAEYDNTSDFEASHTYVERQDAVEQSFETLSTNPVELPKEETKKQNDGTKAAVLNIASASIPSSSTRNATQIQDGEIIASDLVSITPEQSNISHSDKTQNSSQKILNNNLEKSTNSTSISEHSLAPSDNYITITDALNTSQSDSPSSRLVTSMTTIPTLHIIAIPYKDNVRTKTPEIEPMASRAPSKWSTEWSLYAGVAQRSLNGISGEQTNQLLALQRDETALHSLGIQGILSYQLSDRLRFMTGIDYQQITTRIIRTATSERTSEVLDTFIRIDAIGGTERLVDRFEVTERQTTRYERYTRIGILSVPIFLNYTAIERGKWRAGITGGILLNSMIQAHGSTINNENTIEDFQRNDSNNPYALNNRISYQLGSQISLAISNKNTIGFNIFYRSNGNLFSSTSGISSHFQSFNAALSFRKGF